MRPAPERWEFQKSAAFFDDDDESKKRRRARRHKLNERNQIPVTKIFDIPDILIFENR
jgi:hypothetical protein